MKRHSLLIIFSVQCLSAFTQPFWSITNEFPGGPKTSITLAQDSCLLVGLTTGVIRSFDEGQTFEHSLSAPAIFTLYSKANGKVLAGGPGKIYLSEDLGQTWDSITLNSAYPVTQFIENQQGDIFAATGMLSVELGYVGDGVLCSEDGGVTWEQRNNGLGIYECCERIAIDRNDRLYVAMADEYVTGNGGLFISDDHGETWEHITIYIDGQGVVDDRIKIANTYGLSVSPEDSLYFSFAGTAVNALVTVNTRKSIDDIRDNSYWKVFKVFNSVSWWLDRNLSSIFYASDGTWYASTRGTTQTGGTYFSVDGGLNWTFTDEGLGVDIIGTRRFQNFTENSDGKIFMAQWLDEQVYFTEKDPSSVNQRASLTAAFQIYPNPVDRGEEFLIEYTGNDQPPAILIFDIHGRKISAFNPTGKTDGLKAPDKGGIYFIVMEGFPIGGIRKLIVN